MRISAILNLTGRNRWSLVSQSATEWCSDASFLLSHQLKCSSQPDCQATVLPASQTHRGQNSTQGVGVDCPIAVHVFRENLKDEEMSLKTAHTQWPLDLQGLRQESLQMCPQRNLSSRNAWRPHKRLSWWALPLISFSPSQTHIQNLEKFYFPTKPKQIKYSSHPLLMYLT